jgi:hypothetical protein
VGVIDNEHVQDETAYIGISEDMIEALCHRA